MKFEGLKIQVDNLVGHPDRQRDFSVEGSVGLRFDDAAIDGPVLVEGIVRGTADGVLARFAARAEASLSCVRCLTRWTTDFDISASQHFSPVPDEDGYAIVDGEIEIMGPARDELALALPPAPVCRTACKGLCPICGTDLNTDPCDGHGDDSDSPFSVLKDLFEPS